MVREAARDMASDSKNLHFGKDGFQACVDVHHFQPSEVTVKTVDHTVIIEGKHEERDDGHGSVERHFVRKYVLPKEYDMNQVHSTLSSDGVLTIKVIDYFQMCLINWINWFFCVQAPPPAIEGSNERHVPITHIPTPAHLSVKHNKKSEEEASNGK